MQMQTEFLADLQARLDADSQIQAAWLEGSFGRGAADRYSDIDLHVLPADFAAFREGTRSWLESLRPLVLYKLLFDGRMVNALTNDGLRIDVWLHDAPPVLDPSRVQVLHDRTDALVLKTPVAPEPDNVQIAATLLAQIEEFWRCIALMPPVIGRNELLVAFTGMSIELNLLVDILTVGYGRPRERGAKVLNTYLGETRTAELEAALDLQGLNSESVVMANMAMAGIMRSHGPLLAERHGFTYPQVLEDAVLRYVTQELKDFPWERAPRFAKD